MQSQKRTEKSKKKQKETIEKKQFKKSEDRQKLEGMKTEMIQNEFKKNLKENMEQRLFDLMYKLKHLNNKKTLSLIEIDNLIRGKNTYGAQMAYTNEEIALLFEYYREFIIRMNEKTLYVPSKNNFCAFAGISSATYDEYLTNGDPYRRDTMKMIDDYIADVMLGLAQNKTIDNITTIYRTKAEHRMIEATAPIVIEHRTQVDVKDIQRQLQTLKQRKKFKDNRAYRKRL